jgi:hypothetical protein
MHPQATKHIKRYFLKRKKKKGNLGSPFVASCRWSPPALTSNKTQTKNKMRELDFMPRLGDGAHLLPKATKQKEKKLTSVKSWRWCPPKPKQKKRENRVLSFKQ